jgi:hypothetical protein
MSSEIIYHQTVMRMPKAVYGTPQDVYFWLWQIGSSNCYESDHKRPGGVGRRARSWQLASFGTRQQVMRTAIYFAGDCEGGMLKLRSASTGCDPETLIRSVRRLLAEADKTQLMDWSYKGQLLRFTLRSRQNPQDSTSTEKAYSSDEFTAFFEDHPGWLQQQITNASRYARVHGPEMR